MAEREIYNPATGEYELAYDDGIYETNPFGPPPVATPPPDAPPPASSTPTTPNTPPPATIAIGTRRVSRPGFYEEWDGTKWVEYSDGVGDPKLPRQPGPVTNPAPTPPPPITSVPGADGETATAFDWPGWESAGPFQPRDDTFEYTPFSYSDFSYDPYKASSWEDAEKEPGYGASRTQLRKQIEAGAAHRGMLRSGMTIGDLYTGLDSLGQQNFANFDNRNFRNYSANRGNAFENWSANKNKAFEAWSGNVGAAAQKFGLELGVDRDVYDRRAADIDKGNNYRYNVASSQFQDMLSRWQERVRSLTNIATAGANS